MLQQTQVERVIPYFKNWLVQFPTVEVLAKAPLSEVLQNWQGLGYNRRAKMLHEAAKVVATRHAGRMPRTIGTLEMLPGVGHYTARAVMAFAYNKDVVFVETNLRTAITHHFFPMVEVVKDSEVLAVLEKVLPNGQAREWYAALMDYGAHLKSKGIRINNKARHYKKQSAFEGSNRQVRGAIVRALATGKKTKLFLTKLIDENRKEQVAGQIIALLEEGLITRIEKSFALPE